MTTLMMPSDYGVEMFLGSSPVLTSGYLASQPFLHDYSRLQASPLQTTPLQATPLQSNSLHSIWSGQSCGAMVNSSSFRGGFENQPPLTCSSSYSSGLGYKGSSFRSSGRRSPPKKKLEKLNLQPIKSCLVARQDDSEQLELGAVSPTRLKKKVVFADTQGHPLTEVRVLTERSDCPPRWSADFLEQVTGGAKAEAVSDQWELAFAQPASNYMDMKARLEKDSVCLENVLIKESESKIVGTVKVRNVSYHKRVIVRMTVNHWGSHEDVEATYVPSACTATGASYDLYDTFSFALPLPVSTVADKLEFCVRFIADTHEHWDNNNGKNYVIVSFRPKNPPPQESKPKDIYDVEIDAWSEFASWNHLSIKDSPYW